MVMSGSLCFLLLPSGFDDLPDKVHTKSLESLPSFLHLKPSLGVMSDAAGSLCVRSSAEVDGFRKLCCGISNSQHASDLQVPACHLIITC